MPTLAAGTRGDDRPLAMTLDRYKPSAQWYVHEPDGIHGGGHAARVLVWAEVIGRWLREQGETVDLEVIRWAAALHDIRRVNDGKDPAHGERAAQWARDSGHDFGLTKAQRQWVGYCCTWHVPSDGEAPALTPELISLKDGDALDRVRLGDLQPEHLRTACAHALLVQAHALFHLSEIDRTPDRWEASRRAARQLQLWR